MNKFRIVAFVPTPLLGEVMELLLKNNDAGVQLVDCDLVQIEAPPKAAKLKALTVTVPKRRGKGVATKRDIAREFLRDVISAYEPNEEFPLRELKERIREALPDLGDSTFWTALKSIRLEGMYEIVSSGRYVRRAKTGDA